MESMHLTARLVIEQNMHQTTAFSARPDSPVLPGVDRRRPAFSALGRLGALLPRRRATLRHAPA